MWFSACLKSIFRRGGVVVVVVGYYGYNKSEHITLDIDEVSSSTQCPFFPYYFIFRIIIVFCQIGGSEINKISAAHRGGAPVHWRYPPPPPPTSSSKRVLEMQEKQMRGKERTEERKY